MDAWPKIAAAAGRIGIKVNLDTNKAVQGNINEVREFLKQAKSEHYYIVTSGEYAVGMRNDIPIWRLNFQAIVSPDGSMITVYLADSARYMGYPNKEALLAALIKVYNLAHGNQPNDLPNDILKSISAIKQTADKTQYSKGFFGQDTGHLSRRLLSWTDFEVFVKFTGYQVLGTECIPNEYEFDYDATKYALKFFQNTSNDMARKCQQVLEGALIWAENITH